MIGPIYIVTVFEQTDSSGRHPDHRVWGWMPTHLEAAKAVLTNATDMFEGRFYRWAVIEEVKHGIIARSVAVEWFEASLTEDREDITVAPCAPPEWSKGSCNWSMG